VVAAQGGDAVLVHNHAALQGLLETRPNSVLVNSTDGEIERTYRSLLESLS
jgi:hypothetical protein